MIVSPSTMGYGAAAPGTSQSQNQSTSQSTSYPVVQQTPQSEYSLALSQAVAALGANQAQWAQDQYAQLQGITDDQINNYMKTGQYGLGLAANNIGRYENIFQPVEDKYVQNAESYASPARQRYEMGMAESDTGQAIDQGLANARHQLESMGVDPSSGRYADLITSGNIARSAAQAGAGNVARRATEATGNQMLLNAANIGAQYPGQAINALNSTYQGIAGAENAALGTANTGVNLTTSPNQFFSTATHLTPPAQGQASESTSQSTGTSNSAQYPPTAGSGSGGGAKPKTGGGGENYGQNGYDPNFNNGTGTGGGSAPAPGYYQAPDGTYSNDPSSYSGYGGYDPNAGDYSGASSGYSSNYDQYGDYSNTYGGGGGYGEYQGDTNYDLGGAYDSGGYEGYDAGGGVLPDGNATTGGHVPESASPSMGMQTDDVPARLNAGEFVVPRDVAAWKGQEFFQKLIAQARAARTGAPAKASKKPALPNMGKPSFVSRPGGQ